MDASTSIAKASSKNRGAHLTAAEAKAKSLAIGGLITDSQRDEDGRIHLNPIVQKLSDVLGNPCALTNFATHRKELLEKLAKYYNKHVTQIYKGMHSGTWFVPILRAHPSL